MSEDVFSGLFETLPDEKEIDTKNNSEFDELYSDFFNDMTREDQNFFSPSPFRSWNVPAKETPRYEQKSRELRSLAFFSTVTNTLKRLEKRDPILSFRDLTNKDRCKITFYYHGFTGEIEAYEKNNGFLLEIKKKNLSKKFPIDYRQLDVEEAVVKLFKTIYHAQRIENVFSYPTHYFNNFVNKMDLQRSEAKMIRDRLLKEHTEEKIERELAIAEKSGDIINSDYEYDGVQIKLCKVLNYIVLTKNSYSITHEVKFFKKEKKNEAIEAYKKECLKLAVSDIERKVSRIEKEF